MQKQEQQTAVDILFAEILELLLFKGEVPEHLKEAHRKAKEIEKVRIESTWIAALDYAIKLLKGLNNLESKDAFDQFYNETYGGGTNEQ